MREDDRELDEYAQDDERAADLLRMVVPTIADLDLQRRIEADSIEAANERQLADLEREG